MTNKTLNKELEMNKAFNTVYGQASTRIGWHGTNSEDIKVIVAGMKEHCDKLGLDCTESDINSYVTKNLDELKKGYADFSYQPKMMN
ncbi:MAG TPA: hypothetical protein VJY37_04715 [Anaerovoracaceae bacterium]|nr:hypothetical protein [Anaerovoracaceae bacterium]